MTRSGEQAQCGVCVLTHHVLMLTRSEFEEDDYHLLRVYARLLGLKIRGANLLDHIKHFDTNYKTIELVRKIESDRIYEPDEEFDGKIQSGLEDI